MECSSDGTISVHRSRHASSAWLSTESVTVTLMCLGAQICFLLVALNKDSRTAPRCCNAYSGIGQRGHFPSDRVAQCAPPRGRIRPTSLPFHMIIFYYCADF